MITIGKPRWKFPVNCNGCGDDGAQFRVEIGHHGHHASTHLCDHCRLVLEAGLRAARKGAVRKSRSPYDAGA